MPPNLSMSTGFGLFRNSNFLTDHERVENSYIGAFTCNKVAKAVKQCSIHFLSVEL